MKLRCSQKGLAVSLAILFATGSLFIAFTFCQSISAIAQAVAPSEVAKCEETGSVRYHGECMTAREKNSYVDSEIIHIQKLLDEAQAQYRTIPAERLALMFKQTEDFARKFEHDEPIDEHIEEKMILLLGFLYMPAERLAKEMKMRVEQKRLAGNPIAVLEEHDKAEAFSARVHVPIMTLFGERIRIYVSHHGRKQFEKLMFDNSLGDIVRLLE